MPIAVFGKKVFQVSNNKKYTFNGLTWGGDLQTELQEKVKSKPSTYIKGVALDLMSFSIPLRTEFGIDVRKEIESWESIKLEAQPNIFILGTKPLGQNKWLLKSTSVSDEIIDNNGNMINATLKLGFEEYVREGKVAAISVSSPAAVGINIRPNQDIFNPSTKPSQKRDNPNMKAVTAKLNKLGNSI
jgi:hypothetical protein